MSLLSLLCFLIILYKSELNQNFLTKIVIQEIKRVTFSENLIGNGVEDIWKKYKYWKQSIMKINEILNNNKKFKELSLYADKY